MRGCEAHHSLQQPSGRRGSARPARMRSCGALHDPSTPPASLPVQWAPGAPRPGLRASSARPPRVSQHPLVAQRWGPLNPVRPGPCLMRHAEGNCTRSARGELQRVRHYTQAPEGAYPSVGCSRMREHGGTAEACATLAKQWTAGMHCVNGPRAKRRVPGARSHETLPGNRAPDCCALSHVPLLAALGPNTVSQAMRPSASGTALEPRKLWSMHPLSVHMSTPLPTCGRSTS